MSVESRLADVEESLRLLRDANQLQGRRMSAEQPIAGEVITWNAVTKKWEPNYPLHPLAIETDEWTIGDIANTGAGAADLRSLRLNSGTTGSSTVSGHNNRADIGITAGVDRNVINWAKRIVVKVRFTPVDATTNGVTLFTLGKDLTVGIGDLTNAGIGFKISNLALAGHVHDGTSATTTSTFSTLTEDIVVDLVIVHDGNLPLVTWFLDGTNIGTSTAGPTAAGTAGDSIFQFEVANTDAAQQQIGVHELSVGSD